MDCVTPESGVSTPIHTQLPHTRARKEPRLRTDECGGDGDHAPRDRSLRRLPDQASCHHTLGHHGGAARVHAYQLTLPCHVPRPDDQNIIIFADAFGTMGLTPAAGRVAPDLPLDETGQLRQHHLTGTTIFGASSHGELKTLAIIVDAVTAASKTPRDQPQHVWVVIHAAVDFEIVRRLARQPMHKATGSSLGTQALHL